MIAARQSRAILSAADWRHHRRRWWWLVAAPIGAGLLWRTVRWLLQMPLWGDEAGVAINLWERSWTELLRPLDRGQVAPPLFLLLEWGLVHGLQPTELVFRLGPWCFGMATPFVFLALARTWLRPVAACLATGMAAVSYYAVRHSVELKPYGIDLFWACVLLTLAGRWLKQPERTRPVWVMTALLPAALALSFPSVFVAGSVAVVLLAHAVVRRSVRLPTAVYCGVLGVMFLVVHAVSAAEQYAAHTGTMLHCWNKAFPPSDPGQFARWCIETHTGNLFAHPLGGKRGGSVLTFGLFIAGVLAFRRRVAELALLLGPFGLTFLAAALHRYPYGGSARVSMHLAPAILLLAATGLAHVLQRLKARGFDRPRLLTGITLTWCLMAGLGIVLDIRQPAKTADDAALREAIVRFAQTSPHCPALVLQPREAVPGPCVWYLERSFADIRWGAEALRLDRDLPQAEPLSIIDIDHAQAIEDWVEQAGGDDRRCRVILERRFAINSAEIGDTWLELAHLEPAAGSSHRSVR